jgi:predicted GNAT family N-acyltransferase
MKVVTPQTQQDRQAYFDLRWRLLRAPWQQPKGSEQDVLEDKAYHVMVKAETGEIVGVGRIHEVSAGQWQIRYMAVDEGYRGQGIGAMILRQLESHAQSQSAKQIILNARETAIGFYSRHGYQVCGDAPTLFGVIKHKYMQKILPSAHP